MRYSFRMPAEIRYKTGLGAVGQKARIRESLSVREVGKYCYPAPYLFACYVVIKKFHGALQGYCPATGKKFHIQTDWKSPAPLNYWEVDDEAKMEYFERARERHAKNIKRALGRHRHMG